jgi:hypothetical protein
MMTKKILPFTIPITSCYPATSGATGILFSDPQIYEWIFNSFIQIFEVEDNHALDYYDFAIDNNPYLSYNELDYSFIYNNWESITDFVKRSINDDYYVRLFVNVSKLPIYDSKGDMQHDLLIFGYDEKEQLFHIADHFNSGFFEKGVCKFSELEYSMDTFSPNLFPNAVAFLNSVQLIKKEKSLHRLRFSLYNPDEMAYIGTLNITRIIASLSDYLDGVPTVNWYTRGRVMDDYLALSHKWGINCYSTLKLHVQESINGVSPFSLQSFKLMHNHKIVMVERLKVIRKKYSIPNIELHIDNSKKLCESMQYILNKFLKSIMYKKNPSVFEKIIVALNDLQEVDYNYTKQLYEDMKLFKMK